MHTERSIDIDAPPERVWSVMADVARWPEWTESVSSVEVPSGPLAQGTQARITQPRLGTGVWRVTAVDEPRSFTWESSGAGTRMVATHAVTPRGAGGSTVTLIIDASGWAVAVLGWLMAPMGRRYMEMEASGLKNRVEGGGTEAG